MPDSTENAERLIYGKPIESEMCTDEVHSSTSL